MKLITCKVLAVLAIAEDEVYENSEEMKEAEKRDAILQECIKSRVTSQSKWLDAAICLFNRTSDKPSADPQYVYGMYRGVTRFHDEEDPVISEECRACTTNVSRACVNSMDPDNLDIGLTESYDDLPCTRYDVAVMESMKLDASDELKLHMANYAVGRDAIWASLENLGEGIFEAYESAWVARDALFAGDE